MNFIETPNDAHSISAYNDREIVIDETTYTHSLLITPDAVTPLPHVTTLNALTPQDWAHLTAESPEILLLGTGQTSLPQLTPTLTQQLLALGCPYELMTTPAACRTHNLLLSDARRVTTLLIL